ncbi:uncharacterized protein LOC135494055 [Lineus longissimus]|uniref:uncharacterized protein LOC135494055 n=1 Tax=Lineus longissimus TaxID=88925 RepID=UPI00315C958A
MNASRLREEVELGKVKQKETEDWLKEHKPPPDVRPKTAVQATEVTAAAMIAERQLDDSTTTRKPNHVSKVKCPPAATATRDLESAHTTELDPESPAWEPRPPIDEWIDKLVAGQETVLPKQKTTQHEDPMLAALVKLESDRGLPATQIPVFDGTALLWPKFVEQFYTQVHCKPGIDDARCMDLLQSHVSKDALTMIRGIGYSGRCYADALKELKRAFGHRNQVARAYLYLITTGNTIPSRNSIALRQFFVDIRDCIITLTQLNYTSDMQGSDLLLRVSRRISVDRIRFWNRHVSGISKTREPSILDLRNWLKECVDTEFNPYSVKLETSKGKTPATACSYNTAFQKTKEKSEKSGKGAGTKEKPKKSSGVAKQPEKSYNGTRDADNPKKAVPKEGDKKPISCPLCKEPHRLYRCFLFVNKRPHERSKIAEDSKICLNCLHSNHELSQCLSNLRCREPGCQEKHHTLLHPDDKDPKNNYANIAEKGSRKSLSHAYFQLVRVNVSGRNGRCIPTVTMLDSASEITVIHQQLAQDLGLKGKTKELTIKTLNAESSSKSQTVSFTMRAAGEESAQVLNVSDAWTVDIDAFKCPPQQISTSWDHIQELGLTDIDASEVQLLIGVDVPLAHVHTDTRMGDETEPIAVKTPLGWMLMGMSKTQDSHKAVANINFITSRDQQLHQDIEKFWQTESFGVAFTTETPLSAEDKRATKILEETTHLVDGHYEVGMLWKDPDAVLPNNKHIAVRRYHLLEKRMKKDSEFKSLYADTLNGYIEKGFARKLSVIEAEKISPKTWYIPHHGVMNPNKPGKIRVVFDAAATCQGTSLNLNLMTGPDLLNSLFGILQRFRLYRIAMCADVEGMFHMVRVPETTDADAMRFIWKSDIDAPGPPESYKMLVHTFGATDSPTCANYALQRCAKDS